jgi:MFS family permease
MMDLFYSIVIYFPIIGPIILTLMGAIFATRSLEPRRKKYRWRIAFVVIGLTTVLCAVYSANKAQEVLRGGEFCYFTPLLGSQQSEGFKIMSWNPSRVPIYDVYLRIRNADDVQSNPVQIEVGNIPPTIKEMNFRLPFGIIK